MQVTEELSNASGVLAGKTQPTTDDTYVYVVVRTDIPLEQQLVQTGHACLEAGKVFTQTGTSNLVLLAARDEEQLHRMRYKTELAGISSVIFYEPDYATGYTAFCTEALGFDDIRRAAFRNYSLWKAPGT